MTAIKFENVSKKYKLYSKGGLYMRDRITHALQRFNPFNGRATALERKEATRLAAAGAKSALSAWHCACAGERFLGV